ncbi:MAG: hypothetical protein ACK4N5_22475, partial [Myxococcales bacterium]
MPEPLSLKNDPELTRRIADYFNQWEMLHLLGIEVDFPAPDRVRATIPQIKEYERGGLPGSGARAVNGGIIAAVFDLVIGLTALVRNHPA